MPEDSFTISWTIDWVNGEPTEEAPDLHYDKYGNILEEDENISS